MLDVLTVGDLAYDTVLHIEEGTHLTHRLPTGNRVLQLPLGAKIPVDQRQAHVGGNAANVAVALARLGLRSGLWAVGGDDLMSHTILTNLTDEGVDTVYVHERPSQEANSSVILSVGGERTILSYHVPKVYHWQEPQVVRWVYLTSLGEGGEALFAPLLAYVARHSCSLVFQPGTHQLRLPQEQLTPLFQAAHLVILNWEEAETICGKRYQHATELLHALHALGGGSLVVTDGKRGSWASTAEGQWHLPILAEIHSVEATGAGDAFASGVVAALMAGQKLPGALRWGQFEAAAVIQKVGAQTGLLRKAQVAQWDRDYPALQPHPL